MGKMVLNRRRFFSGLAKAAAIVALAPQLCFRVRPEGLGIKELGDLWITVANKVLTKRGHWIDDVWYFTTPDNMAVCAVVGRWKKHSENQT